MKASHLLSAVLALTPALFSLGCMAEADEASDLAESAAEVTPASNLLCVGGVGQEQCIAYKLELRRFVLAPRATLDESEIPVLESFRRGKFVIQDSNGQNCLDVPYFEENAGVIPTACIAGELDPRAAAQLYRLVPATGCGEANRYLIQNAANPNFCIGTNQGTIVLVSCDPTELSMAWSQQ